MNNPITENLPADLPEDWGLDETLAPDGTYVGLTEQHGYNYLMAAVNAAQRAAKQLGEALAAAKASDFDAIPDSEKGKANGVAELDSSGKVPAAQLPAMDYDPAGSADAVQKALNTHTSNKQNPHGVTATQVGAYTKEQTLQAEMAALYPGLSGDSTPNDAFAFLGNYTQWRWNRRTVVFEEVKGDEETISFGPADKSFTVDYASRITIDQENGNISLQSPTSYSFTVTGSSSNLDAIENKFNSIKGKYIKSSGDVYFLGANFTCTSIMSGGSSVYVYLENAKKISVLKNTGHWEEVRASTDDAYPNSGIHDGYEYVALGMPLENAKNRIPVIGSYTGTGVYGEENKNHISLPGKPLCILIFANKESSRMFISCESDSGTAVFSSATDDYFNNVYSFDNNGNDLYWYCNYGGSAGGGTGSNASAYGQLNSSGVKYNYIALYGGA